jgi:hypothetical protein
MPSHSGRSSFSRTLTAFLVIVIGAAALAACGGGDESNDQEGFQPLAQVVEDLGDALGTGIAPDFASGFRSLRGAYLDADGETRGWRISSGKLVRLSSDSIAIFISAEGGGEIEWAVTDATVFSPSLDAFEEGRCIVVLTEGTQRAATAVGDIEETHASWCGTDSR